MDEEHESKLSQLVMREIEVAQQYHSAMRSIAAALAVDDIAMAKRVLDSMGYRIAAAPRPIMLRAGSVARRRIEPTDPHRAKELLAELDHMSAEAVRELLSNREFALRDLHALAVELGADPRSSRENLVAVLAPRIANFHQYWQLGKTERSGDGKTREDSE